MSQNKFTINMVASAHKYHFAAMLASATFRKFLKDVKINVFIPEGEDLASGITNMADKHNINIVNFKFDQDPSLRYATQLKPQAFMCMLNNLEKDEYALIMDSDTYCIRSFDIPLEAYQALKNGKTLFTREPWDRYESMHGNKSRPDYIPKENRLKYINSGVMVAGCHSIDLFSKILELSKTKEFSLGPLHDQTVINYCACMYFKDQIDYIDKKYNGICTTDPSTTLIGHNGQGVGVGKGENSRHENIAKAILEDREWFCYLQNKKKEEKFDYMIYKKYSFKDFMEVNFKLEEKKRDFIKTSRNVYEINIGREHIPNLIFNKLGFKTGAEIGVKLAGYSKNIIKKLTQLECMYLVDPWRNYPDEIYRDGANSEQAVQDERYNLVKEFFADKKEVKIIREESIIAADLVADNSLDFVYIDANHAESYVYEDLKAWYNKVKEGGIIAGHDIIGKPGVEMAVKRFMVEKDLHNLYVTNDNPWRSYLFQKEYS